MTLRPYREADWTEVCAVYDLAKPDELRGIVAPGTIPALDADEGMTVLFRASKIVVAEHDRRVVGFAGSREDMITWLFVHPAFRRQGIAKALLMHLVGRLTPPITLNVARDNAAARALYQRIGFTVEREFRGHFHGVPCEVARLRYGESERPG